MTNRSGSLGLACLALTLAAGGLLASNVGFKLNRLLQGPSPGVSVDGTNQVGLPFLPLLGLTDAAQWATQMGGLTSAGGPVINIQRFDPSNNGYTIYSGGRSSNFTLQPGVGYRVRVNSTRTHLIVGSHDPTRVVSFRAAAPGVSTDGTNLYAYPYHGTATNASQLASELGGLTGVGGPVVNVQRFDPAANRLVIYNAGRTQNFALDPGAAYFVRVTSDIHFVPSHF